jgi:hypothetical protein
VPDLRSLGASAPLTDVLEALDPDGGVIVHDLVPSGVADAIVADLDSRYTEAAPGSGPTTG